jgi:hypothetical protein
VLHEVSALLHGISAVLHEVSALLHGVSAVLHEVSALLRPAARCRGGAHHAEERALLISAEILDRAPAGEAILPFPAPGRTPDADGF